VPRPPSAQIVGASALPLIGDASTRYADDMARTLDLAPWAGRWVAVDAQSRVRCDAGSLAELLDAIAEASLGDVDVMRAPAPDDPVVYGLG
jgi:hypothetical protein